LEKKYHKQIGEALNNISQKKIEQIFYKVESRKSNPVGDLLKKIKIRKDETPEEPAAINRFGLNAKYIFNTFVVGKGNELAHAASQAVAANPGNAYNPLFIYGGVGLGKTHLLQAIGHELTRNNQRVLYVSSEKFTNEYIQAVKNGQAKDFKDRYRNVDCLLVDDIQFMAGKDGTQEEFFHTFNELHQSNRQIVITSDRQPKSIPALEKRLLSRFEWGMIADITQPDIDTRVAILGTKCKERNYTLENDILYYIANNVQSNIRELEGALNRIIAYHEFNNSNPTIDSVKSVLTSLISTLKNRSTTTKNVLEAVSNFFSIPPRDLTGKSRKKELVYPRQITMYLLRKELNTSYPTIGQELGGRDHTTAMHAYNKMQREIEESEKVKQDVDSIRQVLYTNA
jgi:chromosomal replication initiator protein